MLMLMWAMRDAVDPEIIDVLLEGGCEVELDEEPFLGVYQEIPIMRLACFAKDNAKLQISAAHKICQRMRDVDKEIKGETPLSFCLHALREDIAMVILQYGAKGKARRGEFKEVVTWKELLRPAYEPPEGLKD
ncbi:Nitrogen permease reactivator protein [Neonectria magnoliae]|uniref:Nitrogen permease reactivator protein n=1 Tax=Neonectria magnoliae TaxID=2732573 RepID=A0ABR1HFQ7_9HYPO